MARWKIDDFRDPSIQIYFDLCMENLYDWEIEDKSAEESNREKLRDFLVKNDLEDFTDWLLKYQKVWNHVNGLLKEGRKKKENRNKYTNPYALNVARILKLFLSGETREYKGFEISAKFKREKINIAGKDLFDQLKIGFVKEFERLGLNETELSIDEAKEELENTGDLEWLGDHGYDCEDIQTDSSTIEMYRLAHFRPREISLQIVNKAISEIEITQKMNKKGVGARLKNLGIAELAKRLSYLHRIRQFLNNKENTSIKDSKLSNETCRFIYDYFEYLNILPDSAKHKTDNKENRANYIKSLIKNNETYFKKDFSYIETRDYMIVCDEKLELKIDLFKKVKDGLLTPSEYYERT